MALTGAWKSSPAATQGEDARAFVPRDNWGEGVDPRHSVRTAHDVWSDQPYSDPTGPAIQEQVPAALEDSYNVGYVPPTLPMPYDEPAGHDGIQTAPWGVGPWRSQDTNNAARSVDRGMARYRQTRDTVMRSVTATYDSQRRQSLAPSRNNVPSNLVGVALRALRGRNSLAVNNPGDPEVNGSGNYIRQGWEQVRFTDRAMPRRGLTHTKRFLHMNLADGAIPSTAPLGDAYSPYTSPFDGRTTSMATNRGRGVTRREPRPWDEDTVTDGSSETESYGFQSWGL